MGRALLGPFHRLDDLAERGVMAHIGRADLQRAGLVDRPSVHKGTGRLLGRHGLASDRGLVHKRIAEDDHAVHRHAAAGLDHNDVAHLDRIGADLPRLPGAADEGGLRQEVEEPLDGAAAPTDGQALQHFGDENEDTMTRAVNDSPTARAAAKASVIDSSIVIRRARRFEQRLLEDRVASDQHGGPGDHVEAGVWLPDPEPDGDGGDAHQGDARRVRPLQRVVVVFVVGGMLVSLGAAVSRRLVHVHRDAPFESSAISNTP